MMYELTVTPKTADPEGFSYVVRVAPPVQDSRKSQMKVYERLSDVEDALQRAGFPELRERAGKTLELGKQLANTMDISDEQISILVGRG